MIRMMVRMVDDDDVVVDGDDGESGEGGGDG